MNKINSPATKFVNVSGFMVIAALPAVTTGVANIIPVISNTSDTFGNVSINNVEAGASPAKAFSNSLSQMIQRLRSGERPSIELIFDEKSDIQDTEADSWMRLATSNDQY